MFNKQTNERTQMELTLYTAICGKKIGSTAAILRAPSGLERVTSATSSDRDEATMTALKQIVVAGIRGNGLEITLSTNDSYLNSMLAGEYKRMKQAGEEIEHNDLWAEIIAHLKAHDCRLKLGAFEKNELSERAKITAQFMLQQEKAARKTEEVEEEVAS